MSVDQRLRDASEQLRIATDSLRVPPPRFAQSPRHRQFGAPVFALAALVMTLVVAIGFIALSRDSDSEGRLSTVSPPTTTIAGDPDAPVVPTWLQRFAGTPAKTSIETLTALGLRYEIRLEGGADIETGRVVSQDIPWGSQTEIAPLIAAGRVITLRVGPSLAIADDEVDVGLTGDAPNGKWRVVASDTNGDYCVSVFNQTTNMTSCHSSLSELQNGVYGPNYNPSIGVYAGTAPAGTIGVELLDASGRVVTTAAMSTTASARFHGVTFWAAVASQPNLTIRALGGPSRCVGTGPATVKVPDAIGKHLRDAITMMRDAGLDVIGDGVASGDPTNDDATVRAQEPPPGTSLPRGDCVGFRTR